MHARTRAATATARRFAGDRLLIASHNAGKVAELAWLLAPLAVRVMDAGALGLDRPPETGASFAENAVIKARSAAAASGLPALADDSGLVVPALGGAPGIHSARWAGPGKDFAVAMARLQRELEGQPDRRAHFVCALALAWPDGHAEVVEGRVDGRLIWPPRGERGFGYDPIFVPDGHDQSFGEMPRQEKHAISHRADACRKLIAACFVTPR
ncbi:MAG: RdgB/HAM1 family non-canonical purine NTP pyrophosphatase [Kiloniellales bacterium]